MTSGDALDDAVTAPLAGSERSPAPAALGRGAIVGRFVIIELAGEGGMAKLYRAFDPQLDRSVALKILEPMAPTEGDGSSPNARLLREAKTLARLSHPNVVPVYDAGIFEAQVFIAMEFVDGVTLRQWLRTPRRLDAIVRVFLAAGEGLAAAHAAGLVHRDFKPDNVIVGYDGRVRVVDFGLARDADTQGPSTAPLRDGIARADASAHDDEAPKPDPVRSTPRADGATLTRTGVLVGTPMYMAPEQYEGLALDARTDQFAFVVALYEAVYRVHPFAGATRDELQRAIVRGELAPPPAKPRVPRWLRAVMVRGLAHAPGDRFGSVPELLRALERGLGRRSRAALVLGALAALAAATSTGYALRNAPAARACDTGDGALAGVWDAPRKDAVHAAFARTGRPFAEDTWASVARSLDAYAAEWSAMRTDACRATRVRNEQSEELLDLRMQCLAQRRDGLKAEVDLFTTADEDIVIRASRAVEKLPSIAPCADGASLRTTVRAPADPAARARVATVREQIASVTALRGAAKFTEAMPLVESTLTSAVSLDYAPLTAEALLARAGVEDGAGKYDDAAATYHRAAVTARTANDEGLVAEAWLRLAFVTGERLSRYAEAQRWADYAEETMRRTPAAAHLLGELLRTRGVLFFLESKYEPSLVATRAALAWAQRDGQRSSLLEASCLADLADTLSLLSRYDESRRYYEDSIAILKRSLGAAHPDVAVQIGNLGRLLRLTGDPARSFEAHREALAIQEAALGPNHPNLVVNLVNSAEALLELDRPHEAREACDRALLIARAAGSETTLVGAYVDEVMAQARIGEGDFTGAEVSAERAIATYDRIAEPGDEDVVSPLLALGEARLHMHAAKRALSPLLRALPIAEKHEEEGWMVGRVHFAYARALDESGGDPVRAREAATKASAELAGIGPRGVRPRATVDAWLMAHGGRSP